MWFRLSSNSSSNASSNCSNGNSDDIANNNNNNNNDISSTPSEPPSKFEKFRRASFRRKSSSVGPTAAPRKRSMSPHAMLQKNKSSTTTTPTLTEANENEEAFPNLNKNFKSEISIDFNKKMDDEDTDNTVSALLLPISDPKYPTNNKKLTLKAIKTEPPKRKFSKGLPLLNDKSTIASRQSNSHEGVVKSLLPEINDKKQRMPNTLLLVKENPNDDDNSDDSDNDDDDNEDDSDIIEDDTDDDDDGEKLNDKGIKNARQKYDNTLPMKSGKEKILMTDPKYKRNRIEKSSSKTKVVDLDKRESIKRSRSSRKIPISTIVIDDKSSSSTATQQQNDKKSKKDKENSSAAAAKKQSRGNSNLNLQALVKFVVSNKRFLHSDDGFTLMRRKSISEAASTVLSVASSCKPLPIALKYGQDGAVAEAPKELDAKTERNVVLVKQQKLKSSFCERKNSEDLEELKQHPLPPVANKDKPKRWSKSNKKGVTTKIQRNGSSSSKSSGNFEDEAFYSCDEQDKGGGGGGGGGGGSPEEVSAEIKRKSSSPSLTSRVAAKINETTNNYKNRKAKKRKTSAAGKRAEFYKQISVERLNASSIVRQPSDRRPDASGGNAAASSRPNGSASHNSSDLQTSIHGRSASGDGNSNADVIFNASSGGANAGIVTAAVAAGTAAPPTSGVDVNAQDAIAGSGVGGDSRDSRRERSLHHQHQQNKSAPVSVNRSESYKERLSHKRDRNSRRKTSDPSLTSRPNDEHAEAGLSNSNYTASSNSSLSSGGGSESPSTSMEQVGGGGATAIATTPGAAMTASHHHHHGHHGPPLHAPHLHSHQDSFHGSLGGSFWGGSSSGPTAIGQLTRQWNFESDDDDDLNEADWSSNVAAELLAALTDAEKKRQEIINEIYQTERSHVRTLKLLERLFFCPLQESGVLSNDHLKLLFPPALLSLRELHSCFEQKLKLRRIEHNHVVSHVGDLLISMFDGPAGEDLCEYAAQFCARQQIALEALKEKRRKDEQLQKLLSKAESHKACRRLQLKDLLPTVLQRLTKYPLLFENLYKVTVRVLPENTTETDSIQRALESSKKILVDVNQAVKTAEDAHKLQNIQRKLDKSTYDKDEFKNLDLTQHRLIHDGSLTMKKNPSIQLHGLLFENMIVLLTKQDDKYSLKHLHAARNEVVNNKPVHPIMNIDSETLVRQEAADKNSFFLIQTRTSQMLELRAPSSSECKTWFKHISDAAEQYKPRSKNANHEPVDDPAIATLPHSNTKESLEQFTPERPSSMSATATVTTTPLAPMMQTPTVHSHHVSGGPGGVNSVGGHNSSNNNNSSYDGGIQMRNGGRRESTPLSSNSRSGSGGYDDSHHPYQNVQHNRQQYELSPAVNRTMSTRSCGEANNNYGSSDHQNVSINGITLRHTQSARQATSNSSGGSGNETNAGGGGGNSSADGVNLSSGIIVGGSSKRDSASIVYSNNSNNTRTLMQSPLVEPTAIQISISPAHTAEPVLTPSERLRRLDASIRDGLLEKQKIICDMFRLPVEHFHEIVDIAAMPEAPKDSADIALAAYAQVQSLTEVLNEYMHVTAEQEISAISTSVCDQCHEKQQQQGLGYRQQSQQQQQQQQQRPTTPQTLSSSTSSSSAVSAATQIFTIEQQTPPPLPPPNKQSSSQMAQQQTPAPTAAKMQTPIAVLDETNIHEDDDGYCEIDELRLPALPNKSSGSSPPPPLPPPAGTFKALPPPPPPLPQKQTSEVAAAAAAAAATTQTVAKSVTPELIKRQSTISTDSIPEESADELTQAALEDSTHTIPHIDANETDIEAIDGIVNSKETSSEHSTATNKAEEKIESKKVEGNNKDNDGNVSTKKEDEDEVEKRATSTADSSSVLVSKETNETLDPKPEEKAVEGEKLSTANVEELVLNEALSTLNKLNAAISTVDNHTQTTPMINTNNIGSNISTTNVNGGLTISPCGPNRLQHANSLEPSIPCHALNSIVSALNSQISLLLPKINERDMERERLRKENQHLRELLNAMHERQRVEDKLETPKDVATNDDKSQMKDIDGNDETDKKESSINTTTIETAIEPTSPTSTTMPNESTAATTKVENRADN